MWSDSLESFPSRPCPEAGAGAGAGPCFVVWMRYEMDGTICFEGFDVIDLHRYGRSA